MCLLVQPFKLDFHYLQELLSRCFPPPLFIFSTVKLFPSLFLSFGIICWRLIYTSLWYQSSFTIWFPQCSFFHCWICCSISLYNIWILFLKGFALHSLAEELLSVSLEFQLHIFLSSHVRSEHLAVPELFHDHGLCLRHILSRCKYFFPTLSSMPGLK